MAEAAWERERAALAAKYQTALQAERDKFESRYELLLLSVCMEVDALTCYQPVSYLCV